jgi:hypothetical protein
VAWVLLAAFTQAYSENHEQKTAERLSKLVVAPENKVV